MIKARGCWQSARDLCRQAGDTVRKGSAVQAPQLCSAPALQLQCFCCISLGPAWLQGWVRSLLRTPGLSWLREGWSSLL